MFNIEDIEYKINYFKSELLSKRLDLSFLQEIETFLETNSNQLKSHRDLFLQFLGDLITLLPNKKYNLPMIDNLFLYNQEKNRIIQYLQNDNLSIENLDIIDSFFLNPRIIFYVNLDTKNLRQIEDKLYRRLLSNNKGSSFIREKISESCRLNLSLGIFLIIDFYRKNKHPAQIVTFDKGAHFGHYDNEAGNINIDLEKFYHHITNVLQLENSKEDNTFFNMELMKLIYHECVHFKMLYKNDSYHYETELVDIVSDFDIDEIHDSLYLEFCANAESCLMSIDLIRNLAPSNGDYLIYLLENSYQDILSNYFHTINGVRTIDPHDEIYKKVEEMITTSKEYDARYLDYALKRLRNNKNDQEISDSVFDAYSLTVEELKRIFLVILLEHKDGHTYSRFNQDVLKDILVLDNDILLEKYLKLEYRKSLQALYVKINSIKNYDSQTIKEAIMSLPMDYPFLDKIQVFSNKKGLISLRQ